GARLESVYTGNRIVGSNPTPSATGPDIRFSRGAQSARLAPPLALLTTALCTWRGVCLRRSFSGWPFFSEALYHGGRCRGWNSSILRHLLGTYFEVLSLHRMAPTWRARIEPGGRLAAEDLTRW